MAVGTPVLFAPGVAVAAASAQSTAPAAAAMQPAPVSELVAEVDIPYTRFTLDNGLTVLVHEDHKAPVVAVRSLPLRALLSLAASLTILLETRVRKAPGAARLWLPIRAWPKEDRVRPAMVCSPGSMPPR
jgi:hypothetical protein